MSLDICAVNEGLTSQTTGLVELLGFEISATVSSPLLQEACYEFVKLVGSYAAAGNSIRSGETVKYGYWCTLAKLDDSNRLVFWEYNPETADFVFGVNNAVSYWRDQHQIGGKVGAAFTPPSPDQLVVISDGIYEGDEVEGVRYPSPDHMSGWWLTTDRFKGDTSTLKTVHVHHVTARRPDLAKFLALPFGYRSFSPQSDVWFDKEVADAKG